MLQNGHLNAFIWAANNKLFDDYPIYKQRFIRATFIFGDIDAYKWGIHMFDTRLLEYFKQHIGCEEAAANGQLHMLKWLRETQGYGWNSSVCITAAANGHLDVLKYAVENGCVYNDSRFNYFFLCASITDAV